MSIRWALNGIEYCRPALRAVIDQGSRAGGIVPPPVRYVNGLTWRWACHVDLEGFVQNLDLRKIRPQKKARNCAGDLVGVALLRRFSLARARARVVIQHGVGCARGSAVDIKDPYRLDLKRFSISQLGSAGGRALRA
ncbi:MAG TPA: hypothetical protein VMU34_22965 [Mycobacterium sp.]|nr:hypothetical protein [Mycobacterium sp.]